MAIKVAGPAQETGGLGLSRVIGPGRAAWWLSAGLGVAAAASSLLTFTVPANRLFPLYLVMLALAAWSIGALLGQADVAVFGALFSARTPVRGISVYMWTVVALNTATWLARIIPAVARGGAPGYLRGTGLTVNVVYVQDLALWLPLLAVAAAWLWRRRPWGYLLAGAGLVMWALLILRRYFFLQPVIAGIGAAEILLAWRWRSRA